jgi:hypothetical protein
MARNVRHRGRGLRIRQEITFTGLYNQTSPVWRFRRRSLTTLFLDDSLLALYERLYVEKKTG